MAITEQELREAEARLVDELRHTATAIAARYDRGRGRVVIRLNTGLEVMFPPHDAEGLERATAADLEEIEISPTGLGLHFPRLDADLYVPALLQGLFGSKRWMAARRLTEERARTAGKSAVARSERRRTGKPAKTAAGG